MRSAFLILGILIGSTGNQLLNVAFPIANAAPALAPAPVIERVTVQRCDTGAPDIAELLKLMPAAVSQTVRATVPTAKPEAR
jgi:hypothetical protein